MTQYSDRTCPVRQAGVVHMIRLLVDPLRPDPAPIAAAAAVIRGGGIVAYPTDTLYGLGADPGIPARWPVCLQSSNGLPSAPFR